MIAVIVVIVMIMRVILVIIMMIMVVMTRRHLVIMAMMVMTIHQVAQLDPSEATICFPLKPDAFTRRGIQPSNPSPLVTRTLAVARVRMSAGAGSKAWASPRPDQGRQSHLIAANNLDHIAQNRKTGHDGNRFCCPDTGNDPKASTVPATQDNPVRPSHLPARCRTPTQ
ncbi:hypothetical protein [Neopusillimonas aromaticivorans]|uniref:hypothetical protein n=1 Tax=Neopusillimonas aromaticivorans TaxID=2979868 RepID=UPI003D9EBF72